MNTKVCTKCGEEKCLSEFYKHPETSDGYYNSCKKCNQIHNIVWNRTKTGVVYVIYTAQKHSSVKRKQEQPKYSYNELKEWLLNQKQFHEMYDNWVSSGFDRWKKPSCDRIDNNKGYSFDNIQLVTWMDNCQNYKEDLKTGKYSSGNKPVMQYDLDGNFIKEHLSVRSAARSVGIESKYIRKVCNGEWNYAHGYKWVFKN